MNLDDYDITIYNDDTPCVVLKSKPTFTTTSSGANIGVVSYINIYNLQFLMDWLNDEVPGSFYDYDLKDVGNINYANRLTDEFKIFFNDEDDLLKFKLKWV